MDKTTDIKIISIDYNSKECRMLYRSTNHPAERWAMTIVVFSSDRPEYGIYGCDDTPEEAIEALEPEVPQKP